MKHWNEIKNFKRNIFEEKNDISEQPHIKMGLYFNSVLVLKYLKSPSKWEFMMSLQAILGQVKKLSASGKQR